MLVHCLRLSPIRIFRRIVCIYRYGMPCFPLPCLPLVKIEPGVCQAYLSKHSVSVVSFFYKARGRRRSRTTRVVRDP